MSGQAYRTATGGRVDRSKPLGFTFNGKPYQGYEGDTLASALLANGVRLVGRSFKYHRPRGILTAGPEEPNALVQLGEGARTAGPLGVAPAPLVGMSMPPLLVRALRGVRRSRLALLRWTLVGRRALPRSLLRARLLACARRRSAPSRLACRPPASSA